MEFTKELLLKFAKLSRIKLTESEINVFTPQMHNILESVTTLQEIDTSKTKVTTLKKIKFSELRVDIAEESQNVEEALANAPQSENNFVKVSGTTFGSEEA